MREFIDDLISVLRIRVNLKSIVGINRPVPIYVFVTIVLVFATYKVSEYALLKDKWRTFYHERYGFSLAYPTLWDAIKSGELGWRGSGYLRAQFLRNGRVLIYQDVLEGPEIADAVIWGTAILERRNVYALSPLTETTIGVGNYPALTQSYKIGWHSGRVYYLVHGNDLYMLKFEEMEDEEPIIDRMLASFQLADVEVSD